MSEPQPTQSEDKKGFFSPLSEAEKRNLKATLRIAVSLLGAVMVAAVVAAFVTGNLFG